MEENKEVRKYTCEEVSLHNKPEDIWIIYGNEVYDVLKYIDEHPGGNEVLLDFAGQDATNAFDDIGHSNDAHKILENLKIGILSDVPEKKKKHSACKTKKTQNYIPFVLGFVFLSIIVLYMFYGNSLSVNS